MPHAVHYTAIRMRMPQPVISRLEAVRKVAQCGTNSLQADTGYFDNVNGRHSIRSVFLF